jgi:hypothetical protein
MTTLPLYPHSHPFCHDAPTLGAPFIRSFTVTIQTLVSGITRGDLCSEAVQALLLCHASSGLDFFAEEVDFFAEEENDLPHPLPCCPLAGRIAPICAGPSGSFASL